MDNCGFPKILHKFGKKNRKPQFFFLLFENYKKILYNIYRK